MAFCVSESLVSMPDGVRLYTVCARPAKTGRFPVVLIRTPYTESGETRTGYPDIEQFAESPFVKAGYALVTQHCRGTGRSEGEFLPYYNERADGLANLDWLQTQDFYGGEVYLTGGSYLATVHLLILGDCPACVKGACLSIQDSNRYNILYANGAFKTGLHGNWFAGQYKKKQLARNYRFPESLAIRPYTDFARETFGEEVESKAREARHPRDDDPFWRTEPGIAEGYDVLSKTDIPLLLIEGWYDIYIKGMPRMWEVLKPETKAKSAMLIGPWKHGTGLGPNDPYPFPDGNIPHEGNLGLGWFDHLRGGAMPECLKPGQVTYYEMNGRGWKTRAALAPGEETRFYLNADAATGERSLGETPCAEMSASYVYDPQDPPCFPGGAYTLANGGIAEQPAPDFRPDVLSFVSAPLTKDLLLEGQCRFQLTVSSDCEDTCFFARLSTVQGDKAWVLRDGITSIGYAHPDAPYAPREPVVLDINADLISWRLKAGDRLRVDIASANFPSFYPHANVAGNWAEQAATRVARNTIHCGLSYVVLPTATDEA